MLVGRRPDWLLGKGFPASAAGAAAGAPFCTGIVIRRVMLVGRLPAPSAAVTPGSAAALASVRREMLVMRPLEWLLGTAASACDSVSRREMLVARRPDWLLA